MPLLGGRSREMPIELEYFEVWPGNSQKREPGFVRNQLTGKSRALLDCGCSGDFLRPPRGVNIDGESSKWREEMGCGGLSGTWME